eukprot:4178905-Pyramimonas_sp.AAC.1
MHRSPTEITAGVSGTTNASKVPPLKLRHATQAEPRALENPPAVFRAIASSNRLVIPIAPAARMNLSAMRLCPQPASTMNRSVPRCTDAFSLRPAAAEPPGTTSSFPSDSSQRCQT